ncbi:MAG: hypothetical protein JOZ09_16685, partial [Pseudonocardiales bacterium]|nr:hypothetical protein [Pseudonocardiales bacterium]
MPHRSVQSANRRVQRWRTALRAWWEGGTPRPTPSSRQHRVVSLVTAALLVLATGMVTLALGPAPASAASAPVAAALTSGLPN